MLLAIAAGGGLGLLIAFGVWKANTLIAPKRNDRSVSTTISPTNSPATSGEFTIVLTKKEDFTVLSESPHVISGLSRANVHLIISGEENDVITTTNESGVFNAEIELVGGSNEIRISAYDDNGNEARTNLTVVYSGQFVRDENSAASPFSYLGTVTDITDSIIQIKNISGDIQQIKGASSTSYIDTRNDTTKIMKESDVAIGDYLIAMGYKNGSNVLNASRVLITAGVEETTRTSFFGSITDTEVGEISVKNPASNRSISVTPADNLQITGVNKFSLLKTGDKIITVGEEKNDAMEARTVKVLK